MMIALMKMMVRTMTKMPPKIDEAQWKTMVALLFGKLFAKIKKLNKITR